MRYLFFLVLLGNVIFFVWEWRTEILKPLTLPDEYSNSYEHPIVLLSEAQPILNSRKKQQPIGFQEDSENELFCFEIGPFDNKNQVLQWDQQNPVQAENISFYLKDVEVVSGFMLFYPPAETLLQAQENVAILEAKGVRDLWLFKFGDMKGAISLGFFNTEAKAKSTQKTLEKLAVDARIKAHAKVVNHSFARIIWKIGKQEIKKLVASYKEKFPDQDVERLPECTIAESANQSGQ